MKKILVVVCCGNLNGNTDKLANSFIEGLLETGHEVKKVFLGNKDIKECKGCGACQLNHHICAIRDDMQDLYPLVNECDTIVIASPLYFWSISAIAKSFIDRLYALSTNDKYPRKNSILLMTAGDNQDWTFDHSLSYYHILTEALGWNDLGSYLAGGCKGESGNHSIDEKNLGEVYNFGKKII